MIQYALFKAIALDTVIIGTIKLYSIIFVTLNKYQIDRCEMVDIKIP